jgi:hypothetical protein
MQFPPSVFCQYWQKGKSLVCKKPFIFQPASSRFPFVSSFMRVCTLYNRGYHAHACGKEKSLPSLFCCLGIGDISCDVSWKTGKIRRGNKRIKSSPWAYKEKSLCTQPVIHSCLLRQSLFDTRPTVLIIDGSNFLFCIYSNMTGRRRRIRATVRGE